MSDWTGRGEAIMPSVLSSHGQFTDFATAHLVAAYTSSGPTNGVGWPGTNRAIYIPFYIPSKYVIRKVFWANGSSTSGNIDIGVYDKFGNRIWRMYDGVSSVGQGTANTNPSSTTGLPIPLDEGGYYMAMMLDNTTGRVIENNTGNSDGAEEVGLLQQAVGSYGLPSTATFAAAASSVWPSFCFTDNASLTL